MWPACGAPPPYVWQQLVSRWSARKLILCEWIGSDTLKRTAEDGLISNYILWGLCWRLAMNSTQIHCVFWCMVIIWNLASMQVIRYCATAYVVHCLKRNMIDYWWTCCSKQQNSPSGSNSPVYNVCATKFCISMIQCPVEPWCEFVSCVRNIVYFMCCFLE